MLVLKRFHSKAEKYMTLQNDSLTQTVSCKKGSGSFATRVRGYVHISLVASKINWFLKIL